MIVNIWTHNAKLQEQEMCETFNTDTITSIEIDGNGELNIYTDKHWEEKMEVLIMFLAGLGFAFLPWIMLWAKFEDADDRSYYDYID